MPQSDSALSEADRDYILQSPSVVTPKGWRDRAILLLLARCGLRPTLIVRLKREAFDGARLHLASIKTAKNTKNCGIAQEFPPENPLILPTEAREALRKYLELDAGRRAIFHTDKPESPLFQPTVNYRTLELHRPLTERMIRQMIRKYARDAGLTCRPSPKHLRKG